LNFLINGDKKIKNFLPLRHPFKLEVNCEPCLQDFLRESVRQEQQQEQGMVVEDDENDDEGGAESDNSEEDDTQLEMGDEAKTKIDGKLVRLWKMGLGLN
jgi:hypothetical protein